MTNRKKTKKRPGFMVYFNNARPIINSGLSLEKIGRVFVGMVNYADTGELPQFESIEENFAWATVKPGIDKDNARYQYMQLQKKYGGCFHGNSGEKIDFFDWMRQIGVEESLIEQIRIIRESE